MLSPFLFFSVFLEDSHTDLFVWDSMNPFSTPPFGKETISCGKEIERGVDGGIGLGEGESKGDGKVRKGCVERYGEE